MLCIIKKYDRFVWGTKLKQVIIHGKSFTLLESIQTSATWSQIIYYREILLRFCYSCRTIIWLHTTQMDHFYGVFGTVTMNCCCMENSCLKMIKFQITAYGFGFGTTWGWVDKSQFIKNARHDLTTPFLVHEDSIETNPWGSNIFHMPVCISRKSRCNHHRDTTSFPQAVLQPPPHQKDEPHFWPWVHLPHYSSLCRIKL